MGAATGLIVTGFNHLQKHTKAPEVGSGEGTADAGEASGGGCESWDINCNGNLELSEANEWYRNGNGQAITVNASSVDLNFVTTTDWKVGEQYSVNTLLKSTDGLVYGQLDLEYRGNNTVKIIPNAYEFEMHKVSGTWDFGTIARNIATDIGGLVAGEGTSFMINFRGVNTINNTLMYGDYSNTPFF